MAYNNELYKHSIYFEIYDLNSSGEAQTLKESFAFTIPPSAIDIVQPQRVTKTKTPGGFFVDNYGPDGAIITINGETGNSEDRLTVLGSGRTPRSLTGQEAYFEFRERIVYYSEKSENYTMYFYDLTHKGTVNIFRQDTARTRAFTESWEVVLDESALRRSSVKPFFYPYSISLTGIRRLGSFNPRAAKNEVGLLSNVRKAIDTATDAVAKFNANVELFMSNNFEYASDITDILASSNAFVNQLTSFGNQLTSYEQKLGGLFGSVISETSEVLSSGIQLISFPYDTLETARNELVNLRDQTETMLLQAYTDGKAVLDKYDWSVTVDPVSNISESQTSVEESFFQVVKTAKQSASYEPIGAVAINGTVVPLYGFNQYTVLGNTRLDRLARDVYGSPDNKDIISAINGIYSNDELVPGTILFLPLLDPTTRYSNNAVYNVPGEIDLLGRDAKIDSDGRFVVSSTDYVLTAGDETIYQMVSIRLSEQRDRQIRDGLFGIVAQIGSSLSSDSPFELLGISLKETLVQDPRITDVYDLNYSGDGSALYQEFKFDTITQTAIVYKDAV